MWNNKYLKIFSVMCLLLIGWTAYHYVAPPAINIPPGSKQTIYGRIVDQQGRPIVAQIQVWHYPLTDLVDPFSSEGKKGRTDNLIRMTYSNDKGFYALEVPADTVMVIVTRGPEWELTTRQMIINKNEFEGIEYNVSLKRLYELNKLGWFAGDTHVHSQHSDGYQYPSEIAHAMQGVGLNWGILTDHNSIAGAREWLSGSSSTFVPVLGNEISTEASANAAENGYGHMNQSFITSLSGKDPSNKNTWARAAFDGSDDVQNMITATHDMGGIFSVNHPYQSWDWAGRFKSWGKASGFNAIEIWNGDVPHTRTTSTWDTSRTNINTWAVETWFSYLSAGNKISGLAGSDCHDIYGTNAYPKGKFYWSTITGNPRTYAYCGKLSEGNLKKSIIRGSLFVTSGFGPILLLKINGKRPGDVLRIRKGEQVKLECQVLSNQPLRPSDKAFRIIMNGKVLKTMSPGSGYTSLIKTTFQAAEDGWIVVEAFGSWPMYAITNPVYLDAAPYGDWPRKTWNDPKEAMNWNKFRAHPAVTIPDGPFSWDDPQVLSISKK